MYKFQVTDGHLVCNALEFQYIPTLPHKVAPGTKIVITNAPTRGGYILLTPPVVKVLGGKVPALGDFEVNRGANTTQDGDAPPPFVLPTEVSCVCLVLCICLLVCLS